MLLLESELTRPSNNLDVIDARQAALIEKLIEYEQEGASEVVLMQLRMWIDRWDRQRERVKVHGDQLL